MGTNYLYNKYKGKYRVLADYDLDTGDFPRDDQGNIDSDFNDFYIPCRRGVQIRHAGRDNLGCYVIATTKLANNILKAIYEKEFKKSSPKNISTVESKLLKEKIVTEFTHYDDGILFIFKAEHLDDWADILKMKTSGASISPLSSKNLPKSDYVIDKKDELLYKKLFPSDMENLIKAQISKKVSKEMEAKLTKAQLKEMKQLHMKTRQYIHYIGKWSEFLEKVKEEISNN